ncbi:hypothetical protein MIND_00392000 [Mycena indigotica]|uniref:Uncharacterized protein n=1 Tax=Mycena indigotica TaxID=2126181 RepID=A0A8H6W905_9AGAR|nr:uncharacterized protein MIND_00392000 [Mycena indigotica]KAF7310184.1 hypothetical protein MIND_00392000 [Mycena indigotica]
MDPSPSAQPASESEDDNPALTAAALLAAGTQSRMRRRPAQRESVVGRERPEEHGGVLPNPLPLPLAASASASSTPSPVARTNGCGARVHASAHPARAGGRWVAPPEGASGVVVPLETTYFAPDEARMLELARAAGCGCAAHGVGCAVCGNALGALFTPCRTHTARSSGSLRRQQHYVFLPGHVSPAIHDALTGYRHRHPQRHPPPPQQTLRPARPQPRCPPFMTLPIRNTRPTDSPPSWNPTPSWDTDGPVGPFPVIEPPTAIEMFAMEVDAEARRETERLQAEAGDPPPLEDVDDTGLAIFTTTYPGGPSAAEAEARTNEDEGDIIVTAPAPFQARYRAADGDDELGTSRGAAEEEARMGMADSQLNDSEAAGNESGEDDTMNANLSLVAAAGAFRNAELSTVTGPDEDEDDEEGEERQAVAGLGPAVPLPPVPQGLAPAATENFAESPVSTAGPPVHGPDPAVIPGSREEARYELERAMEDMHAQLDRMEATGLAGLARVQPSSHAEGRSPPTQTSDNVDEIVDMQRTAVDLGTPVPTATTTDDSLPVSWDRAMEAMHASLGRMEAAAEEARALVRTPAQTQPPTTDNGAPAPGPVPVPTATVADNRVHDMIAALGRALNDPAAGPLPIAELQSILDIARTPPPVPTPAEDRRRQALEDRRALIGRTLAEQNRTNRGLPVPGPAAPIVRHAVGTAEQRLAAARRNAEAEAQRHRERIAAMSEAERTAVARERARIERVAAERAAVARRIAERVAGRNTDADEGEMAPWYSPAPGADNGQTLGPMVGGRSILNEPRVTSPRPTPPRAAGEAWRLVSQMRAGEPTGLPEAATARAGVVQRRRANNNAGRTAPPPVVPEPLPTGSPGRGFPSEQEQDSWLAALARAAGTTVPDLATTTNADVAATNMNAPAASTSTAPAAADDALDLAGVRVREARARVEARQGLRREMRRLEVERDGAQADNVAALLAADEREWARRTALVEAEFAAQPDEDQDARARSGGSGSGSRSGAGTRSHVPGYTRLLFER